MPTDGADFGRTKACYGKPYSAARIGADNSEIAEILAAGIERDIRRDGGLLAFSSAIDLLVAISITANESQLLNGVEQMGREFADSSLTRYVSAAAEVIGLDAISHGQRLSRQSSASSSARRLSGQFYGFQSFK
jgi:hypothetical protein